MTQVFEGLLSLFILIPYQCCSLSSLGYSYYGIFVPYYMLRCYTVATSGEDGRKSLMREIELGKLLGGNPQENIVKFIGCVTTQGKTFQTL